MVFNFKVWDNMMKRRELSKRKLWQPIVDKLQNTVRDDLADLRSMVAREYCSLIVGKCGAKRFHHMNNKNNQSLSGKERQLFEKMITFAARIVWIALERKNLTHIGNKNVTMYSVFQIVCSFNTVKPILKNKSNIKCSNLNFSKCISFFFM